MIEINDKRECSGCTACASSCPTECIKMVEDKEGFKYPEVDTQKCINCHKCEKVCPVLQKKVIYTEEKISAVIARIKDFEVLMRCTSGGVFTALAMECVEQGGIVYGAAYDEKFNVVHMGVQDKQSVIRLAGSKYVQSDIGDTFLQVKTEVQSGRSVMFCGTPCQVAGLDSYLGKKYDNLLLVDLVCHGVPSPKLWRVYLAHIQQKYGKLSSVNFRGKNLGYHVSVMEEVFATGHKRIGSARTNMMLKCFFRNIADRPICYKCTFKTVSRCSDLTLFDSWHAAELVPELKDDDKGYTTILIQSDKGKRFVDARKDKLECYKVNSEMALKLDGKMATNSVQMHPQREVFYDYLEENGIEKTVNKFLPISVLDNYIEKSKFVFRKVGVLKLIKKIKNK